MAQSIENSIRDLAPCESIFQFKSQFLLGRMISEINHQLTAGQDAHRILDFLFESLALIIPFDRIAIAAAEKNLEVGLENNGDSIQIFWSRSKNPMETFNHARVQLRGTPLQQIIDTGRPLIVADLSKDTDANDSVMTIHQGMKSSLTCALKSGGRPSGLVFFTSEQVDSYNPREADLFCEIAEEVSLILEHQRLREYFLRASANAGSISMILHDLRSPLGVIQGFIEASQDQGWYQSLCEDGKRFFVILDRNAKFMATLLDELSQVADLGAAGDDAAMRPVRLAEFLSEVCHQGRLLAERKSIAFKTEIDSEVPEHLYMDPEKIRRVVDNLFSNAVKYSDRQSEIVFLVHRDGDRLFLSVSDQGQGIPDHELPKLFKEFGKTSTRPTEGEISTGLGLAIAKHIVSQHGGEISVKSKLHQGSCFTFWLPLKGMPQLH